MPSREVLLQKTPVNAIVKLRAKLSNTSGLMKALGAMMLIDSQRAFREEKFGGERWPGRYPNQTSDFINIAGAIEDLKTGTNIKKRRFQRRPVLRDKGLLLRSLKDKAKAVSPKHLEVGVGTTVPYAPPLNWGGVSNTPINDTVRENLAKLMKRTRKARDRARRKGDMIEGARQSERGRILNRLGFVFDKDRRSFNTNHPARPFVGITDKTADKMVRHVEKALSSRGN